MNSSIIGQDWFQNTLLSNQPEIEKSKVLAVNNIQAKARNQLKHLVMPNRKQETWRYTDLNSLYEKMFKLNDRKTIDAIDVDEWIFPEQESYRLVMVNGRFNPQLSSLEGLSDRIIISAFSQLSAELQFDAARILQTINSFESDAFAQMNRSLFSDGFYIHVPKNTWIEKPIEIAYVNHSSDDQVLSQPSSLIILENDAQAKVVERYMSLDEAEYFFNGTSDIVLKKNAHLKHYRIQQESHNAYHLSRVALKQKNGSIYKNVNLALGGCWSRMDIQTAFEGQQASCDLQGVYTVRDQQYNDIHIDVKHQQPNCTSQEKFRGIIHGKGRAVFDGRILVSKDAQKTDAQLSNKNLLLVDDAEINTKPQLEIYADDVKCSHGTTVGKINPEHMFYLRARGIPEDQAYRMLCLGFAEQVLEAIEDKPIQNYIHGLLSNLL
ncbi:MAG: Fe-S cluster assembly protein SufD [Gammaproteobacteria bacterium]|nr:Fe-S cluster assembly protein SufD [Gammaproteobacteria bacterium]